jgi:oligopeptidase B
MTKAPIAKKQNHFATNHGIKHNDPYNWLRADNWQEVMQQPQKLNDEIRSYLEAENTYFKNQFDKPNEKLSEKIYKEIRALIKEDNSSIPFPDADFSYFSKMLTGKQYAQLIRTPRNGKKETILLDCNIEAGEDYFGFGGASHSPNHNLLLWSCDKKGSEYYTIYIRDIKTGKELKDKIENANGGGVWANDSKSFYYTELDKNHRPFRVLQHFLGTKQNDDKVIYEEKDSGFFVGIGKTLSDNFITIHAHDHLTSEVWLIDANKDNKPKLISKRKTGHEYSIDERDGELFILTNIDGAQDFKIMTTKMDKSDVKNWQNLIPAKNDALIISTIVIKDYLIRLERHEGLPRIIVRNFKTNKEETISFNEEAYSLGMSVGYEFDTSTIRFSYSSPTTPNQTYDIDLKTGKRTLLKEQEIPSGHNKEDYITRRIFATASDGQKVPITLLYKKDFKQNGKAPCLLYGYGSYGMSMPAAFSLTALSLVDRGFVYAIAHIRGGKEKGYAWYKNGRHENKKNTFLDFLSAADMLIEQKFTSQKNIVAMGGSAGGMLMGAVANMRPEIFAGIIAQVPFVDVLNTMLDDTLPLTPPEWPEWGNPITSKQDYEYIASYSPYDNITAQDYPPIFALAGLTDPRVTYWEPAKWVAKLRDIKTSTAPLYLKTNMGAGHGGASGRFEQIKETAQTYAFAIDVTKSK